MKRVILLADDSQTIRKVVELTFGDSTTRVEAAASGAEAWRRFETLRPDLVLADAVMPDPNGYELCRRVKRSEHPVPVLLLSGTFEPFDRERAAACGADGHLRKPFQSAALLEAVERLLAAAPAAPRTRPLDDGDGAAAGRPAAPRPGLDAETWSPETLDALARAVAERLGERALREAVAELLPEIAERVVRERIAELERLDDDDRDDGADAAGGVR